MRKTLFLLILIIPISTPLIFAHPDLNSVSINDINGPISGIKIWGLENEQISQDVEIEFLSDQWIVKNFVWMLLGSIAIFMSVFGLVVYREDLPMKFLKNHNSTNL